MKIRKFMLLLPLVFMLSACGPKSSDATQIANGIFTAVAQTLTAQFTPVSATETPIPETPTLTPTETPLAFATLTPMPVIPTTNLCDNATFAGDVTIPDGTIMTIGTKFTKTWSVKNTGTCAWTKTFALKFASGTQMSGGTTAIGSAVASGSSINVSISMTAPTTAGTYTGYWRMVDDSSTFFGGFVSVKIVVTATGTATMTPTITLTPTITRTPTNTPVVTQTPWVVTATPVTPVVPTSTYTPTTVPTAEPSATAIPT